MLTKPMRSLYNTFSILEKKRKSYADLRFLVNRKRKNTPYECTLYMCPINLFTARSISITAQQVSVTRRATQAYICEIEILARCR